MKAGWKSAMRDAISEVLETMFFTLVDFVDLTSSSRPYQYASMISLIDELRQVHITFNVTDPFARMITANLVGVDEDEVKSDDLEDTMKELANMIGGNFQARIEDKSWLLGIPSFDLGENVDVNEEEGLAFSYLGDPAGLVTLRFESS